MAGDWIKVRSNLATDPDVVAVGAVIGVDEFAVVGRLHALWAWADQHSEDGNLPRATSAFIDRLTACPGFAEALRGVGWLDGRDSALRLPNWSRHNGQTAKARAVEARKKATQRDKERDICPGSVPVAPGPEKEKSREDKSKTKTVATTAPAKPVWSPPQGWENISDEQKAEWLLAFPACDIDRQLAAMTVWLRANPARAKKSNWLAFVSGWLQKAQNRGGDMIMGAILNGSGHANGLNASHQFREV